MSHFLYLLKIFYLSDSFSEGVSTGLLAESMSVSSASASEMIYKLISKGYISYDRKKGAYLTEHGKKVASELRRAELLWMKFFSENLSLELDIASLYAKKMIEVSDAGLTSALSVFFGNPLFGVGGVAIPTESGSLDHARGIRMSNLQLPYEGVLVGVIDGVPSLMSYLNIRGLIVGVNIIVKEKCLIDDSYVVEVCNGSSLHTISEKIASFLLIK